MINSILDQPPYGLEMSLAVLAANDESDIQTAASLAASLVNQYAPSPSDEIAPPSSVPSAPALAAPVVPEEEHRLPSNNPPVTSSATAGGEQSDAIKGSTEVPARFPNFALTFPHRYRLRSV